MTEFVTLYLILLAVTHCLMAIFAKAKDPVQFFYFCVAGSSAVMAVLVFIFQLVAE